MDSLKIALKNPMHDTMRCKILARIIELEDDEKVWATYNDQLSELANKNLNIYTGAHPLRRFFLKHSAGAMGNKGFLSDHKGDFLRSIAFYEKGLKMNEEIGDKDEMAVVLNNIGLSYSNQGDIPRAFDYLFKSLKIREELGNKKLLGGCLNNIASIYFNQRDYAKALEYFERSLKIRKEVGEPGPIAESLVNSGLVYFEINDVPRALANFEYALKINEEIASKKGISLCFHNIGMVYSHRGDYDRALDYYSKSLEIHKDRENKRGMAFTCINIAHVYLKKKNYLRALEFAHRSMNTSKEIGFAENIRNAADKLTAIYKAMGNHKMALENYELYVLMNDSINNEKTRKASIKSQLKYEYEKSAAADSVKNAGLQKVKDAELTAQSARLKQEKTQFWFVVCGLLFVVVGLFFVWNRFRTTQAQKKIIEEQKIRVDEAFEKLNEKNKEVMDSILYARRIQSTLLTSEKYIARRLKAMNPPGT